ncbi:MAG: SusF/SusE family outer membrane protein [Bacteroidales bacterium]|nr:SusF/SusE family outer membrane protein [Bacteroidales bacterium]
MKRILSIISAGVLVLLAASCVKDDLTMFDASRATAPVLNSFQIGEKEIVAEYTPGVFKQGFNDKIAPNHALAIVSAGGKTFSKTLSTTDKGGVLSIKPVTLAKALMTLGFAEGSTTDVELAVRATMQDPSKDNGLNGFVDSQGRISINGFEVVIPEVVGSPYAEYTEDSPWSVIGSLEAYGISWDGDLNMWADADGNHVAAHVTLKAGDEFKFRKDQDWGVNVGGDFGSLDSEFSVSQDGPNIKVGADGTYDLFVNPDSGIAWISEAYDPYPDFTEASNWSVIGSLSKHGISWDGDIAMVTDGSTHIAFGVNLAADDEFKFRQDASWTVNLGGDFSGLDSEFAVSQDGPNIKVGADGTYDLFVNPGASTAKVSEASGMKISAKIGGDEPGPEPEPVTGWNIIGLNGDWDNDIRATEDNGVWSAYITANEDTEFKWRKDGGWDENYGGVLVNLGEPFEAVAGGDNIKVSAGFWKAELNLNDKTITVSEGHVWSLIGVNGDWGTDIDMVLTDGKWVSPVTKIAGEFKLRENHGWDNNRGGTFAAIGEPFAVENNGANINVEEGNYIVTYDPEAETVVINETGWGLVGTINSWGGSPDIILKESGLFLVAKNVTLTADDEIKLRYKSDWAVNRGARTAVGQAVKATQDGPNIKPGAGTFDVYYRPDSDVIFVLEAGSELTYWGVVGTINGWAAPDCIMYQDESGKFVYDNLETTGAAEIKIRQNEDWAVNRGGDFVDFGEPIAVENNGGNIKLGRDAKFSIVYDPEAETVTLNGEYTGEAPALPETMYIIGDGVGGWDWGADYIVSMTPVNGQAGQFWAIRYIEAGKGFKFCAVKEWNGDFTGLGEDTGYTVADGNCFVAENGVYMIYVDTANKKLCVEKAQVYGIGECFGGWDAKMASALFTEQDGKLVGKTAADGDIRIYAESSIATSDWWTREFVFFDGKIAYRGNGGDQDRVKVEAGKTVTLDFNAGTAVVE